MSNSEHAYRMPSWVLAVISCLLWSSAFAGVKTGLHYAPPLFFAGLRFTLAGLLLIPLAGSPRRYLRELLSSPLLPFKVGIFQTVLLYSLFFLSLSLVPGSVGAVVNGMLPLWAALAAHVLLKDDKMGRRMVVSLVIGFAGIVLLSVTRNGGVSGEIGGSELIGILLMLMASFANVLGQIVVYHSRGRMNSMVLTSSQFIFGGLMLLVISRFVEGSFVFPAAPVFWGALSYLGFLSAAAFSIWFHLLSVRGEKVSIVGIWQFLIPVAGAALSWLIIPGDDPSWPVFGGMVLIAAAIIYFFYPARRSTR
ncbi:DMT family transporter [Marispirochaeta sp.]|uniref:DMT family transporter n=1 Tax=Marispirochaeta sp. TaxID=2038653 RepID=UPI0029C92D86|nr:DMT family transporter [Marispirochaeta sp.]